LSLSVAKIMPALKESARRPEAASRLRSITSRGNALVKQLQRAFSKGELTEEGFLAIEGVRLIEEAIRSGLRVRAVFFSESAAGRAQRLLPQLGAHVEALLLPDALLNSIAATEHAQGVAALVHPKQFSMDDVLKSEAPLVVAAVGVQDPGNLGTVLRSAEAFGASGVLLCEGTVSRLNAKVVRAAAGSLFRMPALQISFAELLPRLRARTVRALAASSHKGIPPEAVDMRGAVCLSIGNEGAGLPREVLREADERVAIPHAPQVDSLNAGVAASLLLYEAARQRGTFSKSTAEEKS